VSDWNGWTCLSGVGVLLCMAVHEEYIEMRIKNVCKGGVDAVIDFVSTSRTVGRATKVLKEACVLYSIKMSSFTTHTFCLKMGDT